ncbi:ribonuclease III domain-containing protein [Cantharellus anzutake]|uniref:ribonuclease III domain-containing protein n=1 Tax=Cantharellus anzutake TaxID=1750568 RepID=UPI00190313C1|nr:ribonuclease III domain-containing protein [Cantharellus anzutake]KAF8315747.1 ribonuclease III domain-containing protein [Cantharellus anzutake]
MTKTIAVVAAYGCLTLVVVYLKPKLLLAFWFWLWTGWWLSAMHQIEAKGLELDATPATARATRDETESSSTRRSAACHRGSSTEWGKPFFHADSASSSAEPEPIAPSHSSESSPPISLLPPLPKIRSAHLGNLVFTPRQAEHEDGLRDNQRLEWLGDAAIQFSVTLLLEELAPQLKTGEACTIRAELVSNKYLGMLSVRYGLFVTYNEVCGQDISQDLNKKIHADLFEAYIGALTKERGFDFVHQHLSVVLKPPRLMALTESHRHGEAESSSAPVTVPNPLPTPPPSPALVPSRLRELVPRVTDAAPWAMTPVAAQTPPSPPSPPPLGNPLRADQIPPSAWLYHLKQDAERKQFWRAQAQVNGRVLTSGQGTSKIKAKTAALEAYTRVAGCVN